MTVKEFANKYEVPYRIAYNVTYRVKAHDPEKPYEYDETELFNALLKDIQEKTAKHLYKVGELEGIRREMHRNRQAKGIG